MNNSSQHSETEDRQVLGSGSAMIASRIVSAALGWLGSVTIARSLSPTDWGIYSFIFALLGLMAVVTDLGVGRAVLSRITTDNTSANQAAAGSFIVLRFVLGLIGYCAAIAYAFLSQQGLSISLMVAFAGVIIILSTPSNALLVLYQSRLHLSYIARWDVIGQVVQLLIILAIAKYSPSITAFIIASLAKEIIVLLARWAGIRQGRLPDLMPTFSQPTLGWRDTLIEAIPLSAGYALFLLLTKIDQLMLERMVGFQPVGIYAISYKFSDLLGLSITALALPFTTVLVTSYTRDSLQFVARTRQALVAATILGSLATAGFLPTADGIIGLLYGVEFESAGLSSRLLVIAAGFSGISIVALSVLLAAKHLMGFPIAALIALVAKIGLNLYLIPLYGINGAAIATVITEGALMVATLGLIHFQLRLKGLIPVATLSRLLIVTSAISYPLMLATEVRHIHWFSSGVLAAGLFALYLFLTGDWPLRLRSRSRTMSESAVER